MWDTHTSTLKAYYLKGSGDEYNKGETRKIVKKILRLYKKLPPANLIRYKLTEEDLQYILDNSPRLHREDPGTSILINSMGINTKDNKFPIEEVVNKASRLLPEHSNSYTLSAMPTAETRKIKLILNIEKEEERLGQLKKMYKDAKRSINKNPKLRFY